MKQHIPVYTVGSAISTDGLINVCNIEEVWLNEETHSVAIRYRSPHGQIIDHEEYYDCLTMAKRRFYSIADDLDCRDATKDIQFHESMRSRKNQQPQEGK